MKSVHEVVPQKKHSSAPKEMKSVVIKERKNSKDAKKSKDRPAGEDTVATQIKSKKVLPRKDMKKSSVDLSYMRQRTALMPNPVKSPELIDKSLHEGKLYKTKINTEVPPQCRRSERQGSALSTG